MTIEKQLADALRECAIVFRQYEQMHLAKGTQEGDEKAHRNHQMAAKSEAALAAYDARPVATDEQVERVARAIYEAGIPKGGRDYVAWDDLDSDGFYAQHDLAMKQASAAIAALQPQVSPELIDKLGKLANYLTEQGEYEACDLIDTVVERVTKPALPPQDGLAELRALLDEHDKSHGETKYTPSKQPVYAMTMDYLHRQTFAAMYAYVRTELERTKGGG